MKRLMLVAIAVLVLPATVAFADSADSSQTIAERLANGSLTVAEVSNLLSGSDLTVSDVQDMTLIEAATLASQIING